MKIFFIGLNRDYDVKWQRTGREHSHDYYAWYLTFLRYGTPQHTLIPYWVDEVIALKGDRVAMNKDLLMTVEREKPDICFFYIGDHAIQKTTIQKITARGVTTVYWCGDDNFRFDSLSKHFGPYYSYVVTTYSKAIPKYERLGCRVIYSSAPVQTEIYHPTASVKDIDVAFVGTWTKPRQRVIEALRSAGISVCVRGNGWPEGPVSQTEMVEIMSRSKIGLAMNISAFYIGIKPLVRLFLRRRELGEGGLPIKLDLHHFFSNLREWLQKRTLMIKGRNFEIPACGSLEITDDADALSDYYVDGEEIVMYNGVADLIKKIKYYLEHDTERERIARAGYERTLRDHTAQKRLASVFEKIGLTL